MKKALVVIDMQNDFIDGSLGTPEAQAIVPKVCEKIESWDGMVWYTQDTHREDYLSTREGKHLPVVHCIKNTEGWKINGEVIRTSLRRPEMDELPVFQKGAFGSKMLAERVREIYEWDGLRFVELIGLCTDICVLANAVTIKTFCPEIELSVDASCCAGVTPQSHKNALEAMKMLQIEIKNEE